MVDRLAVKPAILTEIPLKSSVAAVLDHRRGTDSTATGLSPFGASRPEQCAHRKEADR